MHGLPARMDYFKDGYCLTRARVLQPIFPVEMRDTTDRVIAHLKPARRSTETVQRHPQHFSCIRLSNTPEESSRSRYSKQSLVVQFQRSSHRTRRSMLQVPDLHSAGSQQREEIEAKSTRGRYHRLGRIFHLDATIRTLHVDFLIYSYFRPPTHARFWMFWIPASQLHIGGGGTQTQRLDGTPPRTTSISSADQGSQE